MNGINVKRVEHVREVLDDLEEELLPCYVEEDQRLRELCKTEMFSDEQVELDEIVNILEASLTCIRITKFALNFVLKQIDQQGE